MIEKENEKYYSDLEKRKKLEMILQKNQLRTKLWIFQKMEFELQNNTKPLIDINQDEKMALNL